MALKAGRATRGAAAAALASTALLATGGAAQASTSSIRAVITRYNLKIANDELKIASTFLSFEKTHNATPVHKAIAKELADIKTLRADIGRQAPSTTKGRQGKALFESGLRAITDAYHRLDGVVSKVGVNNAAAKQEAKAADRAVKKGRDQLKAGAILLES